jgi:hypothetical protein
MASGDRGELKQILASDAEERPKTRKKTVRTKENG